jgi:hypothetical protein
MENRRDFFKVAGAAAIGAQALNLTSPAQVQTNSGKFKIIDFRVRPPLLPFKVLFDLKLSRLTWENKFNVLPAYTTSPSMYKVGGQEGLDLLKKEIDEAGIDYIVAPGRNVSVAPAAVDPTGQQGMVVSDETLVDLRKTFDNRLFGLHGLDLNLPTDQLVAALEEAVNKYGLYGAVMEPGYFSAPEGGLLTADHKKLYPLYETLIKARRVRHAPKRHLCRPGYWGQRLGARGSSDGGASQSQNGSGARRLSASS